MNGKIPDRVPKFDQIWPETLDRWKKGGYPEGVDPADYFGYDIQMVGAYHDEGILNFNQTLEETDEWYEAKDGNLATMRLWKHKMGTPEHVGFGIDSREKWDEFKKNIYPCEKRIDLDAIKNAIDYADSKNRFKVLTLMDLFECTKNVIGHVKLLESLALDPEWMKDMFKIYTDLAIGMLDIFFKSNLKIDAVWIWGDVAYNQGLFCSPRMYKRFIFPEHKRLYNYIHDKNYPIIYHSCGNIKEGVPYFIEEGINCLQPMEAKAGVDVRELKLLYGDKISFMGNIDVTKMMTGDKGVIEKEIRDKITLAKQGGGYIYHSDHSVPPGVSFDSYQFVMEMVDKYGTY